VPHQYRFSGNQKPETKNRKPKTGNWCLIT
jgi:hypothetical protein